MTTLICKKGQGTIEAALALPVFITLLFTLCLLLYRGVIYYVADYNLHEALLCAASQQPVVVCEKEFYRRLDKALLLKTPLQISLRKSKLQIKGQVKIYLKPPLSLNKTLKGRFL